MSKDKIFSKEEHEFMVFMRERTASHPDLRRRVIECESEAYKNRLHVDGLDVEMRHSPRKMIEFLSLFSKDDRFKWFTHKWDMSEPFSIDDLKTQLEANKQHLSSMVYGSGEVVNERTYNQVWNFINFDNKKYVWYNNSFGKVEYGWRSVVEPSHNNPMIPVEDIMLGDDNGHQFGDYIRMFKATIEFRTDLEKKDRFSKLISKTIRTFLPKDFRIEFTSRFNEIGYDMNVYCDVTGVLESLQTICNWIVGHKTNSSEVSVDIVANKDSYNLVIMHHSSYFSNKTKLENSTGDFDKLRRRLFSVCDLKLEGDYKQDGVCSGSLLIHALDKNTVLSGKTASHSRKTISPCSVETSTDKIGGVKYVLTIYK